MTSSVIDWKGRLAQGSSPLNKPEELAVPFPETLAVELVASQTTKEALAKSPGREAILLAAERVRAGCWMSSAIVFTVICCLLIGPAWPTLVEIISATYIVWTDCNGARIEHFEVSTKSNPNILYPPESTAYREPQEGMQIKLHVFPQTCADKAIWRYGENTDVGETMVILPRDLDEIQRICIVEIGSSNTRTCLNIALRQAVN